MTVVAAAVIGSAVVGGVVSSNASRHAANTQADASKAANQLSSDQFEENRADLAPYRAAGTQALGQLSAGTMAGGEFNRNFTLADFNADPGYQFRMDQGERGVEASAAARGGALGGGALKALDRYNQDYASGEFQNAYNRFNNDQTTRFNRLSSLAGTGQTATNALATEGTQLAGQEGENLLQGANARASGYIGQANAVTSGLSSVAGAYQQNQLLDLLKNRATSPAYTPTTTSGLSDADFASRLGG